MAVQQVTPELRQWIIAQAQAGHQPEVVLQSMRASGWQEDVAISALEEVLQGFLADHARASGLPAPVPVPEADLRDSPSALHAGGRDVKVLLAMRNPRVIVFGGLLSDDECDELIALSKPKLARSETVITSTGGSEVNAARTSEGMFFERGENPLVRRIESRIAELLNWPHHDYFDPAHAGTPTILKRGGQRVGTLVMYLNTPAKGGGTTFPDVHLEIGPLKGNAVFFSYDRAHPVTRTLHGGAPVVEGEKWVATKWLREGRFT
jgi:prolyl 4-hydroxylase